MARLTLRHRLRLAGNALLGAVPPPMLRYLLKGYVMRPELAEKVGFNVHPRNFDSPIPQMDEINRAALERPRLLPGIDLRVAEAWRLLHELQRFTAELDNVSYDRSPSSPFCFDNGTFTDFDAATLHALIRHLKPARYVEVGCGFSSYISSRALQRNHDEGFPCVARYIDPVPRLDMRQVLACGELLQQRVQDVPLELFTTLSPRDVLFIDTSHVMKMQSDTEYEFLRVLPSLSPGVYIHVHDIFTPYDYPEDWLTREARFALNEQYALECLLSGGSRYRIELPLYHLWKENGAALQPLFPRGQSRPQSMWLQKIA